MKIVQQILTGLSSVLRYLWKLISAMGYKYKKLVLSHSLDFFLAILNLYFAVLFFSSSCNSEIVKIKKNCEI